jgi:hypothetical protein
VDIIPKRVDSEMYSVLHSLLPEGEVHIRHPSESHRTSTLTVLMCIRDHHQTDAVVLSEHSPNTLKFHQSSKS